MDKEATPSKDPNKNWANDNIQFPRLLTEIADVCLGPNDYLELAKSMDLTVLQVHELFERAQTKWDAIRLSSPSNAKETVMQVPYECLAKDLVEGDVVRVSYSDSPYSHATVKHVERELSHQWGVSADEIQASQIKQIHLLRPYVHHSDFIYTGGVICYLGYEDFVVWPQTPVTLLRLSELRKTLTWVSP
jgi:hypothetical protein